MFKKLNNKKTENKFNSKLIDIEAIQRLINVTDDLLKTIITMSSALLGVGFIFDDFVKSPLARLIIVFLFFVGLVISFLGVLPFKIRYDIEDAEELKQQHINTFFRKRRHLWSSACVLAVAFAIAIGDLLVDVFNNFHLK